MKGDEELSYPAIINGLDFLTSVTELLDKPDPGPRALKFAVLHLQAATEVLLKACLVDIDWRLLFPNPNRADEAEYKRGDSPSCSMKQVIDRLNEHGVAISDGDKNAVLALAKDRNKLQHFGATLSAAAVEARAGVVLEFLMRFVDAHLWRGISWEHVDECVEVLERIRLDVPRIRGYATARIARLAPELEPFRTTTVRCPKCGMWSLIVEEGESYCHLCFANWEYSSSLLVDYGVDVLGLQVRDLLDRNRCPQCGYHDLLSGVCFADAPAAPRTFCFQCVQVLDGSGAGEA
ncbi:MULTISPECIES: hypothetical protein [unclassified Streptomyces]|uniref:hypothetical protein n=1 Tax=unclassified Streptomyces TaxID=2593676 RepID=UPI0033BE6800